MEVAVDIPSTEHKYLLDTIDNLREQGINRHVALPQIIVTGDQSAGKSSVLEAISGIAFPTKDNLCTRFPTEFSLRRHPHEGIKVSIIPGEKCSQHQQKELNKFCPKLEDGGTFDLGNVIEYAKAAMGIGPNLTNFSDDILRIEISGPQQPHLTMIDLPGLFQAGNSAQSDEDAETVEKMVQRYISQPRSIILAVVSAKSDFALQRVTRLAREHDPKGSRTLGVITKPDTLDAGSESEVKNRDYQMVMANACSKERDDAENAFFSKGIWATLDSSTVGVVALRARLSLVLKNQIVTHLPHLISDLEEGVSKCKNKLRKLGEARENIAEQRRYLLHISQRYYDLMNAAIDGNYQDPFFGSAKSDEGFQRRFRAVVQSLLACFKDKMHKRGRSRVIVDLKDDMDPNDVHLGENEVLRSAYVEEVCDLIDRNRGCELPGTFNPMIIGELFSEQCKPWEAISKTLASNLLEEVNNVSHVMIHYLAVEETADRLGSKITASLRTLEDDLTESFAQLLLPHQALHPITYNNALTEKVLEAQARRREREALRQIEKLDHYTCHSSAKYFRIPKKELIRLMARGADTNAKLYGSALAVDLALQ